MHVLERVESSPVVILEFHESFSLTWVHDGHELLLADERIIYPSTYEVAFESCPCPDCRSVEHIRDVARSTEKKECVIQD
jgi:hypothetical protein